MYTDSRKTDIYELGKAVITRLPKTTMGIVTLLYTRVLKYTFHVKKYNDEFTGVKVSKQLFVSPVCSNKLGILSEYT